MSERPPATPYRAMRDILSEERPRERLLKHGPGVLSDSELIAIVLGSGLQGENVVDLARRIVKSQGGLGGLLRMDPSALGRVRGLGPAKVAQLAAAMELGRRFQRLDPGERPLLTSPETVFGLLGSQMLGSTKEQLLVLSLDTRGRLLGAPSEVAGGVGSVTVRAAEVFREPMVLSATSIILVHNHPSGDPRPSPQDVAVTRDLASAGELLEIALLDHVVIGENRFVSMKREGLMK